MLSRFSFRIPFKGISFLILLFVLVCLANLGNTGKIDAASNASSSASKSQNRPVNQNVFDLNAAKPNCCGATEKTGNFTALSSPEYETYKLTATYYSLRGPLTATMMLNNKGPQPILATPTFYSMAGTPLHLAPISVPATSYIDVDMRALLASAGDDFKEGSMKIAYSGVQNQLGAQVKLVDAANSLIWAEQMVYTSRFTSSRLENVWWLPFENSDTSIAVSNTTSTTVTLMVSVDGTSPSQNTPAQIILAPWQTRVLDIMDDIVGHHGGHVHDTGGISITHTGNPGAVLARMFISKPNRGYSAVASFLDPESTVSQKWSGNGLRFRNLNGARLGPTLVARNDGTQTSHVNGRIIYTDPNGAVQTLTIPQFTLSGNSTRKVDLDNLVGNLPASVTFGGIEIDYDTSKGTVITSVQSVSNDGNHVFQVPMFDPQNIPSGAAGFPWKADGDFRTIIYVKNETVTTQKFVTHLVYDGGQYSAGERDILPGQTIAIDFRALRDSQTPDGPHRLIPLGADKGQIAWSMRGGQNKTLSYRSEQISLSGGVASTYACANCSCPNRVLSGSIDPVSIDEIVGDSVYLTGTQVEQNCFGAQFTYAIQNITWTSSNSGIETVNSTSGLASAISPGTTTIYAAWDRVWYLYGQGGPEDPTPACDPIVYYENLPVPVEVKPTLTISSIKAAGKDHTALVRVMINNPNNLNITLTLNPKSGTTGSAQFTSNNTSTQTISTTTNVEVKGITESSTKNAMRLEAKYTNSNSEQVSLKTMDFTVVKVTLTIANSGTISSDNDKSSNNNGYLGTTSLGGPSISTGSAAHLMRHRVEIKAAILPANFDNEVVIQREIVESRSYKGTTPDTRYLVCPDTSDNTLLDKTPSSSGNVYDLDAPGFLIGSANADRTIIHRRTNFRQWLTINQSNGSGTADVVLSDDFTWYQRLSVEKVSSSSQVADGTISGDNIIGTGSTGLDWDLGSGSATGSSSCP